MTIKSLFAPMITLQTNHEEMIASANIKNGQKMNIEGKEYLAVPFDQNEIGDVVRCCLFQNIGKFSDVWSAVKGQRIVIRLNKEIA